MSGVRRDRDVAGNAFDFEQAARHQVAWQRRVAKLGQAGPVEAERELGEDAERLAFGRGEARRRPGAGARRRSR